MAHLIQKKGILKGLIAMLFACVAMLYLSPAQASKDESGHNWQDFIASGVNKYKVSFPSYPHHVSETLKLKSGKVAIKYDAYIAEHGVHALYMVLIAEYPKTEVKPDPKVGLDAFLKGILSHSSDSELMASNWHSFQGNTAVDFLVNNNGVMMKGRAVMVNNCLYLVAMESHKMHFQEENFDFFVGSFEFVQD